MHLNVVLTVKVGFARSVLVSSLFLVFLVYYSEHFFLQFTHAANPLYSNTLDIFRMPRISQEQNLKCCNLEHAKDTFHVTETLYWYY